MSYLVRAIAVALCFGSSGCAIHPLPEDVTGVKTFEIVKRIRCETKQAIYDSAVGWLTHDPKVDPASRAIGLQFADGTRPMETLSPKLFKGRVRSILTLFWDTGVAYNFELDMEERNDFNTGFNFLKPVRNASKFTLGLHAQADRRRENTRLFTVTDTFGKLVNNYPPHTARTISSKRTIFIRSAARWGWSRLFRSLLG